MEHEYSPEKWAINDVDNALIYSEETAFNVARVLGENKNANARRIVACVNACKGIETLVLESLPLNFKEHALELDRLRAQNAELVAIFKKHESRIRYAHEIYSEFTIYGEDLEEILTALAKYEESPASQDAGQH